MNNQDDVPIKSNVKELGLKISLLSDQETQSVCSEINEAMNRVRQEYARKEYQSYIDTSKIFL